MKGARGAVMTFILAGGTGTRLRSVSADGPKALMPVGGEPFLQRLLKQLARQQLDDVVLCLGYGAEAIIAYFEAQPLPSPRLYFSVEAEPRGTAGALREAENYWSDFNLILNGDTECPFAFQPFYEYHRTKCADLSIGLAPAADSTRFGRVVTGADGRVETFLEKNSVPHDGFVNAGMYLSNRRSLDEIPRRGAWSVERDWLPGLLRSGFALYGLPVAESFVDIGTPEDYWRLANREVK